MPAVTSFVLNIFHVWMGNLFKDELQTDKKTQSDADVYSLKHQ